MNARYWPLALWIFFQINLASGETLVIFGDDRYAPLIHIKEGKPAGLLPVILMRAEKLSGDHYEIHLAPWKRAYAQAVDGTGGLIGVSYTTERAKSFDYSKPVYNDDIQVVTRSDRRFQFASLVDLKGKLIGGVNGASYGDKVDKAIAEGVFTVERDVGQAGRLRKVLAGRLDAALVGNGQAGLNAIVASDQELRGQRQSLVSLPTALTRDPLHLVFAKSMNKRAAIARFDGAIAAMQKSGELQRIIGSENE